MGTVDGPGVRSVVFTEGCPLRCIYCHNPDTWERKEQSLMESEELAERLLRFYPYIKDGGVTFSGGEPCLQADFICETVEYLKSKKDIHVAIDTCGEVYNSDVERLLGLSDMVLLDVKMTCEEDYKRYTGGSLERVMSFLDRLEKLNMDTWIRHVVVPEINDREEDVIRLGKLLGRYRCIKKIELLPYKNLCIEKYKQLNIPFKLKNTPPMSAARIEELSLLLN